MRSREKLTQRQELFCQHVALSGNGTQAALKAGCRNPNSVHVRANRWLQEATVQKRIAELREAYFGKLEHRISEDLYSSVMLGLESSSYYKKANRVLTLMQRLEQFSY